jgi:LysM repeat protein
MKLMKIVGIVAGIHVIGLIGLAIFGSTRSTAQPAPPTAAAPVPDAATDAAAPVAPVAADSPSAAPAPADAGASINFYPPTRPGTPAAQALIGTPAPEVTPATTYEVRRGDSLARISHRYHVTVGDLMRTNHLRHGTTLHPGQKLVIPEKPAASRSGGMEGEQAAPARPAARSHAPEAAPAAGGKESSYTVRSGDRLSSIAHRFGLTTGQLAAANNITNPKLIRPGQTLVIPAGRHAKGSGRKATEAAAPAPAEQAPAAAPAPETAPVVPAAPPAGNAPADSDAVPVVRVPDASGSSPAPQGGTGSNP